MSSNAASGPDNSAIPFRISAFNTVLDKNPKLNLINWGTFIEKLSVPRIVRSEEERNSSVKLFCPAEFKIGASRTLSGVDHVSMFVLDMDKGHDPTDFIDEWRARGLEFFVYTSFNNSEACPKWRAIFPFRLPVAKDDWEKFWQLAADDLSHGLTDQKCKDATRMFFISCCTAETESLFKTWHNPGTLLDAAPYIEKYVPVARNVERERHARVGGRVGDIYEESVSIAEIIEPLGWKRVGEKNGLEEWRRPDKTSGISATWGYRSTSGKELFKNFSDSVPELPTDGGLTKFALYTYFHHGGDFTAAAKALRVQGYSEIRVAPSSSSPSVPDEIPAEPDKELHDGEFTDAANGERFARAYGDQVRFVAELKGWALWDGCRWDMSAMSGQLIRKKAVESARALQADAASEREPDKRKEIRSFALKSQNSRSISNCIQEAQAHLVVPISAFDQHPLILNCPNAIIDLETGAIYPHDRDLLLSQVAGCSIDTSDNPVEPKVFLAFIESVFPDKDTRDFVLKFMGYSLTGSMKYRGYTFLHGAGGWNGKSTLVDLLLFLLGDYGVTLDTTVLMQVKGGFQSSSQEYKIAVLRGKRLVAVHEVSETQRLNEALIKQLTGGDEISARPIAKDPITFKSTVKIWMTGNNRPSVWSSDNATWNRVNLIPLLRSFDKNDSDPDLEKKLRAEGPQILRYLVTMVQLWLLEGIQPSELMASEKEDYRAENDSLAPFISEQLTFSPELLITARNLHKNYLAWAKANDGIRMSPNAFARVIKPRLTERGCVQHRTTGGVTEWMGVECWEVSASPSGTLPMKDD